MSTIITETNSTRASIERHARALSAPPSYPGVLEGLIEFLAALPAVGRVVLFGSRARGDAGPRSDIDLAIEAPAMSHTEWLHVIEIVEVAPTLLEIDLVRLEQAPNNLRTVIAEEGKVLYARRDQQP